MNADKALEGLADYLSELEGRIKDIEAGVTPVDPVIDPVVEPEPTPKPKPLPTPEPTPQPTPPTIPEEGILYVKGPPQRAVLSMEILKNPRFDGLRDGDRVSGTKDFGSITARDKYSREAQVPQEDWELWIDNVKRSDKTFDTTLLPDGPHFFLIHVTQDTTGHNALDYGYVFIVKNNNKDQPSRSMVQPVYHRSIVSRRLHGSDYAIVNIQEPVIAPIQVPTLAGPTTEAERTEIATGPYWRSYPLTPNPTGLYRTNPMLVQNIHGDYFVEQHQTQLGTDHIGAHSKMAKYPQIDGPRGVATINPYGTAKAGHMPLSDGKKGFMYTEKAGSLRTIALSGEVRTLIGYRTIGVPYTTLHEDLTQEEMVARGFKEWVGDPGSPRFDHPVDLWMNGMNPMEVLIADVGAGCIWKVDVSKPESERWLEKVIDLPGACSVWSCHSVAGGDIFACGENEVVRIRGGKITHSWPLPNAGWIRGKQSDSNPADSFIVAMDRRLGFWLVDPDKGPTQVVPGNAGIHPFVFFNIDVKGLIGPKNRIHFGMGNSFNSNTELRCFDPGEWKVKKFQFRNADNSRYSYHLTAQDQMGHYNWQFATHDDLPIMMVGGITGEPHVIMGDLKIPDDIGLRNDNLYSGSISLAGQMVLGATGGGRLGYNADLLTGMTQAEAVEALKGITIDDADAVELWKTRAETMFKEKG